MLNEKIALIESNSAPVLGLIARAVELKCDSINIDRKGVAIGTMDGVDVGLGDGTEMLTRYQSFLTDPFAQATIVTSRGNGGLIKLRIQRIDEEHCIHLLWV